MAIIHNSKYVYRRNLGLYDSVYVNGADVSDQIADVLGPITWIGEDEGFCQCPGSHLHTASAGKKDCKFYLRPVPTLSCFHSSCRVVVEETSKRLRRILRDDTQLPKSERLTPEQKAEIAKIQRREALRRRVASARHSILGSFAWQASTIPTDTPSEIPVDASTHWREIVGLFAPDDVVWAGAIYDSGKQAHASAFRRSSDWLKDAEVPGQFTCPSVFADGSFSRGNANVVRRPFLVVESDELDRDSVAAVFKWMRTKVGIPLRAVVDTAGKSLHGWFDFPAPAELDELRIVLPELGCDPKMFTASQPCRLPGALRDGKVQKLLFLDREEQP